MKDIESFELDRALPSHQARIAAEKKTNVYFVPGTDKNGEPNYIYAICSGFLHSDFIEGLRAGVVPDYAVVVEKGTGVPSQAVKDKIKLYYGFDTDAPEGAAA